MKPIILYSFLYTLVLSSSVPKRFLDLTKSSSSNQTNNDNNLDISNNTNDTEYNNTSYSSNYTIKDDNTRKKISEEPGPYLIAFFVLFVFIGIYMIYQMKKDQSMKDRTDDIWRFIFFANNGALIGDGICIIFGQNLVNLSPVILTGIIFLIWCIYYTYKYCKKCNKDFAAKYFHTNYIEEIYKLPCFVCEFIGLTDPCCRKKTYTEKTYEDGHKESNYCCVLIFNYFIWFMKRLALLFSILSFYIFALVFTFFWYIARCFYRLKKTPDSSNDSQSEIKDTSMNSTKLNNNIPKNEINQKNNNLYRSVAINQNEQISNEQKYKTERINNKRNNNNMNGYNSGNQVISVNQQNNN